MVCSCVMLVVMYGYGSVMCVFGVGLHVLVYACDLCWSVCWFVYVMLACVISVMLCVVCVCI